MDISIVITAHLDRGYIQECIDSIKNNGFKGRYEIIIAIDGNEDLIPIAQQYSSENIGYVFNKKGNLATNFNSAVTFATGKYLKIIADDDMLYKGCLQQLFDEAERNEADLCIGNIQHLNLDGSIIDYKMPQGEWKELIQGRKLCGGSHIIKRDSFIAVGGFDETFNIAESYILYLKLIRAGFNNFVRIDYPIAIYRHHTQQKSLHLTSDQQIERKKEMDKICSIYNFNKKKHIAIITAMYGRHRLTDKIFAYYKRLEDELKDVIDLILVVAGSEGSKSKQIAESNGWNYIEVENFPLNEKFNSALLKSKEFNPDAVVVIGSDDIIDKRIFTEIYANTKEKALGFLDAYVYGLNESRLYKWEGYKDENREGETCGVGRYFSKEILDKLDWSLWQSDIPLNNSLDLCLIDNLKKINVKIKGLWLNDYFIVDLKGVDNITQMFKFNDPKYLIQRNNIYEHIEEIIKVKRIENCFVARAIKFFTPKLCERWDLDNEIIHCKPLIVFGCYDGEDYKVVLDHAKNNIVVICWAGSDSMRHGQMQKLIGVKNIFHISSSAWTNKDLEAVGLPYTYIPLSVGVYNDIKSEKLGEKIYVYTSKTNPNFYGKGFYEQLIQKYGKDKFIIADSSTFNRSELIEAYKQSFIGLRLVEHDGLSETVAELGLIGRNVIYNGDTPNALNYETFDDICRIIDNESKKIGTYQNEVTENMQQYLKVDSEWLKVDNFKQPLINILIRTCKRPAHFEKCINSIQQQTYNNINVVVGVENGDNETMEYVKKYGFKIIRYDKVTEIKATPEDQKNYGTWFPFNHYLDVMSRQIKEGWIMQFDDDDLFLDNKAVSKIVNKIHTDNDLILWKVKYPLDRTIPNTQRWEVMQYQNEIIDIDISGGGFCYNSIYANQIEWGYFKRGDYRVVKKLFEICKLKRYINECLVGIQDLPNRGKTAKQIEEIKQENNFNINNQTQKLMKIILLKSHYKGYPLGEVNETQEMEETTAKALIAKGIAKEFTADLEEEMNIIDSEKEKEKKKTIAEFAANDANDDLASDKKVLTNTKNEDEEKLNLLSENEEAERLKTIEENEEAERLKTIEENEREALEEKENSKPKKAGRPAKKGNKK